MWSQFKPPSKPTTGRIANEEVGLMPLRFPPLPRLSPYPAPSLASNRCFLSVASMRSRAPCRVLPGSCARDAPRRALTCREGTARLSRRPGAGAPRLTALPRVRSRLAVPRLPRGRPAVATAAAPTTSAVAPRSRWLYPVPATPCEAARRVQKPAGKGDGAPGGKGPRH